MSSFKINTHTCAWSSVAFDYIFNYETKNTKYTKKNKKISMDNTINM